MNDLKKSYGKLNGKETYIYTLRSDELEVDIGDLGARVNSIRYRGTDVVLGFNSAEDYIESQTYAGATIGRVANRIAGGTFFLNGKPYYLSLNEGKNHLHGGICGFDKKIFTLCGKVAAGLVFEYESCNGEEGYPADMVMTVKYTLTGNVLRIEYAAKTDGDTLFDPTNHSFFALNGEGKGDCRSTELMLNAGYYTCTDGQLIPTGEIAGVKNTPLDFRSFKAIGRDFDEEMLSRTCGYDHNYIAEGELMAQAYCPETGIMLSVSSDMPCFQLYTAGSFPECKGKTGNYKRWSGFCIEPQFCPNAINLSGFAKPVLKAGQTVSHYIEYKFDYKK